MTHIVEPVVYQHAENVCSLWLQRLHAVTEPHYSFMDIVHLDQRLDANLDGLRVAGVHALPILDEMLAAEDQGAQFANMLLTLEGSDLDSFSTLIQQMNTSDSSCQALVEFESALSWVHPEFLEASVKSLLSATEGRSIVLGLKTCIAHDHDPERFLQKHIENDDSCVRAGVIHIAANIGWSKLKPWLENANLDRSARERFERGRAFAMLGEHDQARDILENIALSDSDYGGKATDVYMLLDNVKASKALLKRLNNAPNRERDVIRGFGLLGDPAAMDWLIDKTAIPELSRLAGGAISMITGIDLEASDLNTSEIPDGFEDGGLTDDPNDDAVSLEADENLPWPDKERLTGWWHGSAKLAPGRCYLAGREKTQPELLHVLANGMQWQRHAAAMSLALITPESRLFDVRLPTRKQLRWSA